MYVYVYMCMLSERYAPIDSVFRVQASFRLVLSRSLSPSCVSSSSPRPLFASLFNEIMRYFVQSYLPINLPFFIAASFSSRG